MMTELLDRVHNSLRPLDHFYLCDPVTFWPNINIGGRGIVMDYLYAKFGDYSFSRFDFIMRTDKTQSQTGMIAILTGLMLAWVTSRAVSVDIIVDENSVYIYMNFVTHCLTAVYRRPFNMLFIINQTKK